MRRRSASRTCWCRTIWRELQSATRGLVGAEPRSEAFKALPQWEPVSKHEFWAYRQYHRSRPANRGAAGLAGIPRDADALALFVDVDRRAADLQLFGPVGSNTLTLRRDLPPLENRRSGVWQADIPLSEDDETVQRLLTLMGMFGFGITL